MATSKIQTIYFSVDVAPKAHDMGRNLLRGAGLTSLDSITDGGITLYRINSFSDSLVKIVEGVDGSKGVWVKTNTGETNVYRGIFFIAAVNKGETYTLSAWVKGAAGTTLYLEVLNSIGTARKNSDGTDSTRYTGTGSFATITEEWHRVTFTFTVDDLNGGYVECNFFTNAVGEFTICEPKLERGDVATAFCLNEADLKGDKGDKGDTPTIAKLRVDHSALHYNPTAKTWDYDSVTVTIVIFTPEGTRTPGNNDISEYYWLLDNDGTKRASGWGFSATKDAASHTATLYKVGSNVAIDSITVPMVWDGHDGIDGESVSGADAVVYTIEAVGSSNNNSGTLTDDAKYISVILSGDLKLYKTVGSEKTEDFQPPQCWRLTVGGANVDGTSAFSYSAGNNIVTYSYSKNYEIDKDKSSVPGSATISVYKDNTLSEMIASLVIPITLNPNAIVDVNTQLGTINSTTASMKETVDGMQGTIETIKQGQGQISLKVQALQSMAKSRNLISGGNVTGTYNKRFAVWDSKFFKVETGKTYTVTAELYMDSTALGHTAAVYVDYGYSMQNHVYTSQCYNDTTDKKTVRFTFTANSNSSMFISVREITSSTNEADPGTYSGVHLNWVRVDEGDWTGLDAKGETDPNGRTIDAWTPSEEEIDAVNLLPDPDFSEAIGYSDAMGERRCFNRLTGGNVSGMSKDSSTVDGCHGIKIEQSNGTGNTYDILQYIVPFRGAGTYSVSYFIKDLHQTDASRPAWSENAPVSVECHPMDANKTRITTALIRGAYVASNRLGDERISASYTFGDTAVRSGTSTSVRIAYLEVCVYLLKNGSVRVSRLCLSKSDHFIYWNANTLSEERKKDAAQLATGIDIYNKRIIATTDNFTVQNNSGHQTFSIDENGNIVGERDAYFKGTITGSAINGGTINGSYINGSYINSENGTSTTTIAGGQITTNNISATGGNISFFRFDNAGMYSGSIEQDGKIYSGLGLSMNNLSVSGNNNRRISSVFLGDGTIDSRFTNSDNRTVYRVGSTTLGNTFYNYIKLERIGSGSFSFENDPVHAALGIETEGDFCLAALGGPSQFAGMCFASNSGGTFTGDKQHTFYLCSGGTFTMPANPPTGMLIVVIHTNSDITFNGNGKKIRFGKDFADTAKSSNNGEWALFYYDGSYWNAAMMNVNPW